MRIHLKLSPSTAIIPFNHQPQLTGALHKWLGQNNDLHSQPSLYSFSWLEGGKTQKDGLTFSGGATFFISASDDNVIKKIISGIQEDPKINFGLVVEEISIRPDHAFGTERLFYVASPVLVKKKVENREQHFTYQDDESEIILTEILKTKLKISGLPDTAVSVKFQKDYEGAKTKIIHYNKIGNRVNLCPVIVKGTPEQVRFAWNVGVGNSTGIGFGALK